MDRRRLTTLSAAAVLLLSGAATVRAQGQAPASSRTTGAQVYAEACAACHAADGRGVAPATVGFAVPLPDFTDCSFSTVEPDGDWMAVVHQGGPARAFDRMMPGFGEALTAREMQMSLDHIRQFCTSKAWPRGELNLPRPLVTEKAFPENETVLTTTVSRGDEAEVGNELLYEQRLGARSQFEVVVPLQLQKGASGWARGLGDVAFAVKHAIFHSLESGTIVSGVAEVVFPTGKENEGLGKGVTVFEPFITLGQILPADGFVQLQAGLELPTDSARASKEAFWRGAVGRTFTQDRGFGRAWSPMVEVLGARELESGHAVLWDVVPQLQVSLSRRQHILVSAGVRLPANRREGRRAQLITYLLWDWFDGGLLDGWR